MYIVVSGNPFDGQVSINNAEGNSVDYSDFLHRDFEQARDFVAHCVRDYLYDQLDEKDNCYGG